MKKSVLFALALLVFFAVACQKGNINDVESGDVSEVTFAIDLPIKASTKAIGDGTSATELYYAVFSQEGNYVQSLAQTAPITMVGKQAQLKLKLVKNYTYTFVFWAQAPDAPYEFTPETGVVTVDYKGAANDETRDAFCKKHEFKVPDAATFTETVELTRPFAQINFGAADFAPITELGLTMTSTVTISGLADTYDILNGGVSGSASTDLSFTSVPAQLDPVETLAVAGQDYAYVSMNYILASDVEGKLANMTAKFAYNGENVDVEVLNVPFRSNYRTNIIGSFFTDEVTFEIKIDPAFIQPDFVKTNQ
jgi:hypothetical protein